MASVIINTLTRLEIKNKSTKLPLFMRYSNLKPESRGAEDLESLNFYLHVKISLH